MKKIIMELEEGRVIETKKYIKDIETLDLGGSDGRFLTKIISPKRITVVDIDKDKLEKNPSINKIYSDITKIKMKKTFPQITLFEVLEHIPSRSDRSKIFSEAYRLLSPGGTFMLSTPNKERLALTLRNLLGKPKKYPYPVAGRKSVSYTDFHHYEYNIEEMRSELEELGFKNIRVYSRLLQIPGTKQCFNKESRLGTVLYAVCSK